MPKTKTFTEQEIRGAMKATRSNRAAARYLNCSYNHYRRMAKMYYDHPTGKTLFELHLNPSGKGISKFLPNTGKNPPLKDLLEGRISIKSYTPEKLKIRLLNEALLRNECYRCEFHERRTLDMKQPFLLNFKDNNKQNWRLENLEILCYNCYFLYVGEVFDAKQKQHIEDTYHPTEASAPTWDLEGWQLDHFKDLGLLGNDDDENQYISRL